MYGPILRGAKVSLEPPRLADVPVFIRWFADTEITGTLLTRFAFSEEQEEQWIKTAATAEADVLWRIVAGSQTIGSTGIHRIDWINRHGTSGLLIGERSEWGKGYASEAVALRTAYAFRDLGLERLESESMAHNKPMHRALEKSGYSPIGTRRRYIYRSGRWHDVILFEVLRDDWLAEHPVPVTSDGA